MLSICGTLTTKKLGFFSLDFPVVVVNIKDLEKQKDLTYPILNDHHLQKPHVHLLYDFQ